MSSFVQLYIIILMVHSIAIVIKTHNSESRGQEETATTG